MIGFIGTSLKLLSVIKIQTLNSFWMTSVWWISHSFWLESYLTTDGQSASLSWNKSPIWGLRPDFYYCQTVAVLLTWGALSDERVYRLQLLLALASAVIFWSEFHTTRHRILLSQIRDFLFRRLLRLTGWRWRYSTPLPHGGMTWVHKWTPFYNFYADRICHQAEQLIVPCPP
jgi:hypothetical protein